MVVTSKHRTHKVMEAAIRELMGAGTPPRFKFKDTHASIEFPSGYTIPAQATLEAKYDELLALEEGIQKTVMEGDLEVGTSNLFVDTQTGNIGIGTDSPAYTLDVHGSSNVGALTTTSVSGDGSGLTSLNASNLASGTVPSARLSLAASDIPNLDATKITSGTLTRPISTTTGTFSGNVGIGTASPGYKLDVGGDINIASGSNLRIGGSIPVFSRWTASGSDIYRSSGNVGIGVAPSHKLDVDGDLNLSTGSTLRINGTPAVFSNWTVSGSDIYRSSGNVGIGTANPGTNLHLLGVGTGSGPRLRFETLNNGNGDYTVNGTEIGGIQFGADDLTWVTQHMTSEIVGIHKNPNYSGAQGDLAFKTSGTQGNAPTEKMRIRYDGNVGIGTANPEARLELGHYGTALSTDFGAIRITNHATNLHSTSLARFDISLGDISNNTGSGKRKLIFNSKTATSDSTGTDILCLDGQGGNVGIGTTSPTAKLDVEYNQGTLSSYNYSTTSTWHGKGLCLNGGSNSGGFLYGHDINHSIFLRQSPFSTNDHNAYCNVGYHAFYTGGHIQNQTERLRITSDGKVGIGKTSPGAKLDVNGDINSDGLLKIYGLNTRRLLIGYQRYESTTRAMYPHSTSSWQNSWNVTYTRKRAGSKIYIVSDLCLAQAMGSTNSVSYRGILGRAKVNDGVTDRYSDTVTDWQRIDNSFHEYQRQSRIHFGPDNLPGGNTITITMQVSHGGGSGSRSNWGINVWGGRSYIEVFESMEL